MIGKEIRFSKIIQPDTGRTCIVPLDHAVTSGPIDGLSHVIQSIGRIGVEKTNAFVVHKGVLYQLEGNKKLLAGGNFLLHISASTDLGGLAAHKCLVSSVEHAVRLGAIGVSVHVNLGNRYESEMISDLGCIADACYQWGMPVLAMMYVRNDEDQNANDWMKIAHAARIAQELGADIVKIACPKQEEELGEIVEKVQIPVIISGGEKMEDLQFLEYVDKALKAGVSGISAGRNVFQSENPGRLVTWVSDLVHRRKTLEEIKILMEMERYNENADYQFILRKSKR